MKLSELKKDFENQLSSMFPKEEIETFFYYLVEDILGFSRFQVSLYKNKEVPAVELDLIQKAITRLKNNEPIQYIIGETEFYGLPFKVNANTLIPRPETEELVDWVISGFTSHDSPFTILDIGTGSGCIAISLAKNLPVAKVSAVDISEEALNVARTNTKINEVVVNFTELDVLKTDTLPKKYDVIVSNPPYVRIQEKKQMKSNVLDHEPELALFVSNEDPLIFYRKIAELAKSHLELNGELYFEINEYLGGEMRVLLESLGFSDIEVKKDYRGVPRMTKAKLSNPNKLNESTK